MQWNVVMTSKTDSTAMDLRNALITASV
jgi:hypothetical protein